MGKQFFLLIILISIMCYTPFLYGEDEDLLSFHIYKGIVAGYSGTRAGLLFLGPLLDPEDSAWIYEYFSHECHQLPERSFVLGGRPLPICARCTGIVVGSLAGHLSYLFLKDFYMETIYNQYNILPSIGIMLLGMLPLIADGGIQLFTEYESNNLLRLSTGILFGISLTLLFDIIDININRVLKILIR